MSEVLLEWKEQQDKELENLAKQYFDSDAEIKALMDKKESLKQLICDMMKKYSKKKVLTENYSVGYVSVAVNKTFDSKKAKAKLIELKVELDDSYYKIGKSYDKIDIKLKDKDETVTTQTTDPHQIVATLDDLKI